MTIVEIARALGMSHANVYRFFSNKAEIVDAVLDAWLSRVEKFIEETVGREGTPSERLERVVLELHRRRRGKFLEEPELYESFRRVIIKRPQAVAKRQDKIRSVFRRLVLQGIAEGDFRPVDADEAAMALEDATAFFLHPAVLPSALNHGAEERARNVVRRMVAGFRAEPAALAAD
jgi:AcrR family transcriptional regulator